jgi:hypothetical protein
MAWHGTCIPSGQTARLNTHRPAWVKPLAAGSLGQSLAACLACLPRKAPAAAAAAQVVEYLDAVGGGQQGQQGPVGAFTTLLRQLLTPEPSGKRGPKAVAKALPPAGREKVLLVGPGGVGRAEMAATRRQPDPSEISMQGWATAQRSQAQRPLQQLQCALLSMSLPVGVLAKHVVEGWVGPVAVASAELQEQGRGIEDVLG